MDDPADGVEREEEAGDDAVFPGEFAALAVRDLGEAVIGVAFILLRTGGGIDRLPPFAAAAAVIPVVDMHAGLRRR